MDVSLLTKTHSLALEKLRSVGLDYEVVRHPELAAPRIAKIRTFPSIYPLDIEAHDFKRPEIIWLFFKDEEGNDVASCAAKFEDLGDQDVMNYWRAVAKRVHPEEGFGAPDVGVSGKVIHIGDLEVVRKWREPFGHTRAILYCLHTLAFLEWKQAKLIYGFVRESHIGRGKAYCYGFHTQIAVPNAWEDGVSDQLFFLTLPIEILEYQAANFIEYPSTFDNYKTIKDRKTHPKSLQQKSRQQPDPQVAPYVIRERTGG